MNDNMDETLKTWGDVIKLSEEYIDMLMQKMRSMDFLDLKYKTMWRQKLSVALCKHQEIFVLAGKSPSGKYFDKEQ